MAIHSLSKHQLMNSKGTSYLLWLSIFIGFGGIHRLYNGKMFTGLLWLFTGGLFGFGQFIDLFLIPDMVDSHNLDRARRLGTSLYDPNLPAISRVVEPMDRRSPQQRQEQLRIALLKAAQKRGSKISVTQAVADTGADFAEVETLLLEMSKKGYASISNDPKSGAVLYTFPEL
jgi:TM2 domain-containing membrane protein YozV